MRRIRPRWPIKNRPDKAAHELSPAVGDKGRKEMSRKFTRRKFMAGTAAGAALATFKFPAPAIAKRRRSNSACSPSRPADWRKAAFRWTGPGLSNGLVGLSGSLFAQYQGFADVQMGIGMVVLGLASIIIGE